MNEHPTPDGEREPVRPDDELVSAVLDGEATPSERAAVDADANLRARLEEFRALQESNRAVAPPGEAARDRAIARAVAAAADRPDAGSDDRVVVAHHRPARRRMAVLAVAAAVAIGVPLVAVLLLADREEVNVASDEAATQTVDRPTAGAPGVADPEGAATATDAGTFLGTFASLDELRDAVQDERGGQDRPAARLFDAPASSTAGPPAPAEDAEAADVAGLRRCVALLAQELGAVRSYASAVVADEPVLVVVFDEPSPTLVVARPDCTVVARSAL